MTLWVPDIHYGLLLILRDQKLLLEANWNFTHDALQEMGAQFHKAMFRNKSMWMKRMTFLKDLYFVSPKKYLVIWLTILGNTVI